MRSTGIASADPARCRQAGKITQLSLLSFAFLCFQELLRHTFLDPVPSLHLAFDILGGNLTRVPPPERCSGGKEAAQLDMSLVQRSCFVSSVSSVCQQPCKEYVLPPARRGYLANLCRKSFDGFWMLLVRSL